MKVLRIGAKVLLWIVVSVVLLLVTTVLVIQIPYVQHKIVSKGTEYLSHKLNTVVQLEKVSILFPRAVQLKNFYIQGQHKDTLLYAKELNVDVDLLKLVSKKIQVSSLELLGLTAHINRSLPDSAFNFDFITQAFADSTKKKDTKKDTTPSAWKIDVKRIHLQQIYFTYGDRVSGNDVVLKLGELKVDMNKMDLAQNAFAINEIKLSRTTAAIIQSKLDTTAKPDTGKALDLGLKRLMLERVSVRYYNNINGMQIASDIGQCEVKAKEFSLPKQQILLDKFLLHGSGISYLQAKTKAKPVEAKSPKTNAKVSVPWQITVENIDIDNNTIAFNDQNKPFKSGLDFSHLLASGFRVQAKDVKMNGSNISLNLKDMKLKDKSGFVLNRFHAKIAFDSRHAELNDLFLKTGVSEIQDHIEVRYASLKALADSLGNIALNIQLKNTRVGFADIILFNPQMAANPMFQSAGSSLVINTEIKGLLKNISIKSFQVNAGAQTIVMAQGHITGLPDMNKTLFDIFLEKFFITESDVRRLVPKKMLPSNMDIPNTVAAKGYFKGSLKDFDAQLKAQTSIGNIEGMITMTPGNKQVLFNAELSVDNFNLGKLLKQTDKMGTVSLKIKANGHDLTDSLMEANIEGGITKAELNHYTYRNLMMNGCATRKGFSGNAFIVDSNLVFTFNGDINLDAANSRYKFLFNLKGADLFALHLSPDKIRVSGNLKTDLKGGDINSISGTAEAVNIMVIKKGKRYPIDSLVLGSVKHEKETEITMESPILSAKFKGNIVLSDIGAVLKDHFDNYIKKNDTTIARNLHAQKFNFEVNLKDPSMFTDVFVPGLERMNPGKMSGSYDSDKQELKFDLNLPEVQYKGIRLKSLVTNVTSDKKEVKYSLTLKEIGKDTLAIRNTSITGNVRDSINAQLKIVDDKKNNKYVFTAHVNNNGDYMRLHFNDPEMVLNGEVWKMPKDNYLEIGKGHIKANNMRLENKDQRISLDTKKTETKILFQKFNLATLSHLIESRLLLAGGQLDGTLTITEKDNAQVFSSDLTLKDFSYMSDTIGDIHLLANNKQSSRVDIKTTIKGRGNNIEAIGYLQSSQTASVLHFDVNVPSLNLATFQTLSMGSMKQMKGTLTGKLALTGTTDAPKIHGGLDFKDALFDPTFINTPLTVTTGGVYFDNKGINLKQIHLKDSLGNPGTIDGYLYTTTYKSFKFDLGINTTNLLVLNTPPTEKGLYYGKIFLDSDIKIKGDQSLPVIRAKVKMNDNSHFTYVRSTDPSKEDATKGTVVFIDSVRPQNRIMGRPLDKDANAGFKGTDISANIKLSKGADIKILVDKETGDSLNVAGSSNLLFTMDPQGRMSLAGDFRINRGGYLLTLTPLIKRKFTIEKSSTILWTGDPMKGNIDLTAKYLIKTSAADLVEDQLEGSSEEQKTMYKQKLPFEVYLKIKGELTKPQIDFDIDLPEDQKGALGGSVNARLIQLREDKAELEKQVFALLVVGRFIGQNPFQSASGSEGVSGAVRNSASQALSDQINGLAGKYVKGVDVNVGMQSSNDYSSGQAQGRTQVQVGLSKGLFNDRVVVHVGTNIDVEGERARQNNLSSMAGDISVEYKLTPDGRYRLKGFRKQAYEDIIEGELIETGAGLIFVRDYNKVSELFHKNKEKKSPDHQQEGEDTKPSE